MANAVDVALGVRVKSGFAIGVAVAGPATAPRLVAREVIELSDPDKPELRQPYHAGMGRLEGNARLLATRSRAIERTTAQNVRAWLRRLKVTDHGVRRVGLVVGSVIDPETVGSPHIRAHAFEGRLFRGVIQRAFEGHDLSPAIFVERRIYADAVAALHRNEPSIRATVAQMGKDGEGPWRADDKLAALAAWLVLA